MHCELLIRGWSVTLWSGNTLFLFLVQIIPVWLPPRCPVCCSLYHWNKVDLSPIPGWQEVSGGLEGPKKEMWRPPVMPNVQEIHKLPSECGHNLGETFGGIHKTSRGIIIPLKAGLFVQTCGTLFTAAAAKPTHWKSSEDRSRGGRQIRPKHLPMH